MGSYTARAPKSPAPPRFRTGSSVYGRVVRWIWYGVWALCSTLLFVQPAPTAAGANFDPAARPPGGVVRAADQSSVPRFEVLRKIPQPMGTFGATWSSDGTKLASYTAFGNTVTIWDADGHVIRELQRWGAFYIGNALAFVDGDTQIVTPPASYLSDNIAMSTFDIASGKVVREVEGPFPGEPRRNNTADILAVSPDRSLIAVIFGPASVQPVSIYSAKDWTIQAVLSESAHDIKNLALSLAFSADGKQLAVGRLDGRIRIYDVATKQVVQTLSGFSDPRGAGAYTVAFSPDGTMIVTGTGLATISWRYPDWTPAPPNEGKFVLVKTPDPVRVFDIRRGVQVASESGDLQPIRSLDWSPDGRVIAFIAQDDALHLWEPFRSGVDDEVIKLGGAATSLAFSPDGSRLAACAGNYLPVFQITNGNK
jgi:WD40 repeat protein